MGQVSNVQQLAVTNNTKLLKLAVILVLAIFSAFTEGSTLLGAPLH